MAVTTINTNKPINPRGDDKSPKGYNRAALYSGKALDFDGVNDYVVVENITDTYKSFCFYFKPDADITAASSYQRLFGIYEQFYGISTGSATGIVAGETLVFMPNAGGRFATTMEFVAGTWYHVAVVAKESDNTYLMYINGRDKTDLSAGTHIPSAAIKVRLGWDAQGNGTRFNGQIANFKAFSEVLTAAQVLDLYNNPEKIVPTGVSDSALKLWLPMVEGAGTTAYDGSGNGNHGTISGATWTQGVGAPVAQTAVIDWNKGTNLLLQSNQFDTTWLNVGTNETSGQSGYDGTNNAWLLDTTFDGTNRRIYQSVSLNSVQTFSFYAKAGTSEWCYVNIIQSATNANNYYHLSGVGSKGASPSASIINETIESVGNGWYRISITGDLDTSEVRIQIANGDGDSSAVVGDNIYIQDAQLESASTAGPYVLTLSTAQSSEVLIPQSLTSGRDLFYNLFENARKKYALNLDGQSWAEVHDNESLDFGTGDFTLEAWAKLQYINTGSSVNAILSIGTTSALTLIGMNNPSSIVALVNGTGVYEVATIGDWAHIVLTKEGTSCKLYVDATNTDTFTKSADITNSVNKHIGSDSTTIRFYKDQIAQPRIYNRALTADEVEQNYNAGKNTYS